MVNPIIFPKDVKTANEVGSLLLDSKKKIIEMIHSDARK